MSKDKPNVCNGWWKEKNIKYMIAIPHVKWDVPLGETSRITDNRTDLLHIHSDYCCEFVH